MRARLAAAAVAALLVGLVSMALLADHFLRRSLAREARAHVEDVAQAIILHWRLELREHPGVAEAARESAEEVAFRITRSSLLGRDGELLAGVPPPDEARKALVAAAASGARTVSLADGGVAALAPFAAREGGPADGWVVVTYAGGRSGSMLGSQRTIMLRAVLAGLVLGGAGIAYVVWASLAPVGSMADRARELLTAPGSGTLPVGPRDDELARLAIAFNDLLDRMRAALQEKRQMVADASHDLRTPLAAARAELDVALAAASRPAADYRSCLESIGQSLARLERIVSDLFLLAQSDDAGLSLRREYCYLADIAASAARAIAPLAAGRGQRVDLEVRDEGFVQGDAGLLERLVANLLENAVKFARTEGRIAVSVERRGDDAVLTVRDDGPGIPDAQLPHVFSRFYRGDPARGGAGGSGLGLAIVDRIAKLHGGSVRVASPAGGGAEFAVVLPLAPADAPAMGDAASSMNVRSFPV